MPITVLTSWSEDRDWTQVDHEVIDVTPEIATAMLQHNTHNRPFRAWRANEFAELLKAGRFRHTNQGVAFYDDGSLADAQHRLSGIRRSGVTARLDVRYGVPLDAASTLDIGVRRGPGDVLAMEGVPESTTVARALKLIFLYLSDVTYSNVRFGDHELLLRMYDRHSDVLDYVPIGRQLYKDLQLPISVGAAAAYLTGDVATLDGDWYAGLVGTGARYSFDPRTALERVIHNARERERRIDGMWLLAVYGSAYRAYAREQATPALERTGIKFVRWSPDTALPVFGRVAELREREAKLDEVAGITDGELLITTVKRGGRTTHPREEA